MLLSDPNVYFMHVMYHLLCMISLHSEEKSTGFVVQVDECLYLLTTLHSFLTEEQEKMTDKDKRRQIKEAATQAKYRFFYTEQWVDERATKEEIEGKAIVNQSKQASVKFDQVSLCICICVQYS